MQRAEYEAVLKQYWGYDSFRSIQLDIIESIGEGRDTLGLMPTGGGKSITFQVPAMTKEGVCIVVTPLIALMKDQVRGLRDKGIVAYAVNSAMTHDQILAVYDNCILGHCKFLYVSPERLATDLFRIKVSLMNVNMIVVDEAHCISQWGYDFRPSYMHIADLRDLLPSVPMLALTATATPKVAQDIMERLQFRDGNFFKMSFERPNIAYVVRHAENKEMQVAEILRKVPGSAIVYCRSRKKTRDFAQWLAVQGVSVDYFHAGLDPKEKDRKQEEWTSGKTRVIVSTNAFGMGIDKPDVRVVVHIDAPDSLEAYFQEAGRAGRDGEKSYAVFLWDKEDAGRLRRNVTLSFPPQDYIREVYNSVSNRYSIAVGSGGGHSEEFNLEKFCNETKRQSVQTMNALTILERAEYMHYEPNLELVSRLMILVERQRLREVERTVPRLAELIRTVLRGYTGLFTEYVVIDEELIAKYAKITRQDVYEGLLELNNMGIVSYNPQKHTEFITWMQDRLHEDYVTFSPAIYDDRFNDASGRTESVINYCQSHDKCRSRLLMEYFGQKESVDCGKCDVCLGKKKSERLSVAEYNAIKDQIREFLGHGTRQYREVLYGIDRDEKVVKDVLREMIDHEIVDVDMAGNYSLRE